MSSACAAYDRVSSLRALQNEKSQRYTPRIVPPRHAAVSNLDSNHPVGLAHLGLIHSLSFPYPAEPPEPPDSVGFSGSVGQVSRSDAASK